MRHSTEFAHTIRSGSRSAGRHLVVHVARDGEPAPADVARVGFVVSKAVGGAVQRNRVQRRLRAIMAQPDLSNGTLVVVRARPSAAQASFDELRRDTHQQLQRALAQGAKRSEPTSAQQREKVQA